MISPKCRHHSRVIAGWACDGCAAMLCPDCVVRTQVKETEFDACGRCGGAVRVLTRHRAEQSPFGAELLRAGRLPFGREGLISLFVTGGALGLLGWMMDATFFAMKPFAALLLAGVGFGWFFHVVRATANGGHPFEAPDFRDFFADVIAPCARGLFALSFVWGIPLLLYFERGARLFTTREAIAFAIYAWLYVPIAMLLAAIDDSGWSLNPVVAALQAWRLGRGYLVLLAALAPAELIEWLLWSFQDAGGLDRFGVLGAWIMNAALLYPLFVAAYLLGKSLYLHGDRLDYGRPEDYQVPVLEGVAPRGTRTT